MDPVSRKAELLTVEAIKSLGADYIERPVLTHVSIMHVDENQIWHTTVCTTCDVEVEKKDNFCFCAGCQRIVPYPEMRLRLVVLASDITGSIQIILHDRELRYLTGKRARQIIKEQGSTERFSQCFKLMAPKPYTIKINIAKANIVQKSTLYWATNICQDFKKEEAEPEVEQTITTNDTQATSSSFPLKGMLDLNCESFEITKG